MAEIEPSWHCMIDFETLDTVPNAVVLSLGAVLFTKDGIKSKFYTNIDANCLANMGRSVSQATKDWWARQSPAALAALKSPPPIPLMEAMGQLAAFRATAKKSPKLWGNGADFDNAILRDIHRQLGLDFPFAPFNGRCYRTVKNLPGMPKMVVVQPKHNALNDSVNQALHLIEMEKLLPGLLD